MIKTKKYYLNLKKNIMKKQKNYKKTLIACYLGFVTQAISANFAPLLFLTFRSTYGITLEKIAMIPLVFYLTQLLIDLAATKFADKIGYRTCVVASQVLSAVGLFLMAILPEVLSAPFIGILISVVLYAVGSGLIEVLVSPIVEACPFENKDGMMSLLHSFYWWKNGRYLRLFGHWYPCIIPSTSSTVLSNGWWKRARVWGFEDC